MYAKVRDFFNSTETQTHICEIIINSLTTAFLAATKNGNFSSYDNTKIELKLTNLKNSDIIDLSRVFLERFDFNNDSGFRSSGNIAYITRCLSENSLKLRSQNKDITEKKIKSFYKQISELAPLMRLIREHRNFFAHHTINPRNDIGWNASVLSTIIRICEIASVPKASYYNNTIIINKSNELLKSLTSQDETKEHSETVKTTENTKENNFIDKISEINSQLSEIKDSIRSSDQKYSELLNHAKNTSATEANDIVDPSAEDEEIDEDYQPSDEDIDFEQNITPEILRSELRLLRIKIHIYFTDDKSYSPSLNLAVISNIGEILENEPKDLNNFLALSNIKYLYDEYTEIYEKQLKIFGAEIDTLLKNVLWPARF